mmetsp:Transcript_37105/g.56932  ORF Transcript_37105/g.56932 Transcript_37105/m.56932 type:complete len:84 (+) Transcript_37105:317-568(+)
MVVSSSAKKRDRLNNIKTPGPGGGVSGSGVPKPSRTNTGSSEYLSDFVDQYCKRDWQSVVSSYNRLRGNIKSIQKSCGLKTML